MAASRVRAAHLAFALALVGCVCAGPASAQKRVLFVGQNTADDPLVINRITATLGYAVDFVNHDDKAAWDAALPTANMVLISSTTGSGNFIAMLGSSDAVRDIPRPLMCYEDYLFDDMQTRAVEGSTEPVTQMTIEEDTHFLAAGLMGTVTVYLTGDRMNHGTGAVGAGAVKIASINAGADWPILYYPTGGELEDGTNAVAPRLNYFLWDDTFSNLSPDGVKLFDAAINFMIPEPVALTLLAVGGLALVRRRRR